MSEADRKKGFIKKMQTFAKKCSRFGHTHDVAPQMSVDVAMQTLEEFLDITFPLYEFP